MAQSQTLVKASDLTFTCQI